MKKMTITLFVERKSLQRFLEITKILSSLNIENDYVFSPNDLIFELTTVSNWVRINMETDEYLKLNYCILKLRAKQERLSA